VNPQPSALKASASSFLSGLTAAQRTEVLSAGKEVHFAARARVFDGGESADRFFLVSDGCLRLFYLTYDGRKVSLFWLTAGDVLGAAALLPKLSRYLANAETVQRTSVRVWSRASIRALAERYPMLWENGLSLGMHYLTWYASTHLALVCLPAKKRLAQVLVTLSEGIGEREDGAIWVKVTNEELAQAANVNHFTTSRVMADWKKQGLVKRARGGILLRKPKHLLE
jgi:CRP-like cAMP-binding protein